jgi:DNA-binding CsgD family transcriptional regulator/signal transduction histidine kinase
VSAAFGQVDISGRPGRLVLAEPAASPQPLNVDVPALADLVAASGLEVADRAQAALAPVLPHDALVLVTPGGPGVPVQIAASTELRDRLAAFDWSSLVDAELPAEGGAARLVLPDLSGGLRLAGWIAGARNCTVAIAVGAQGPLQIGPAQERAVLQVAMIAAARARGLDAEPSPGTLAFSHAISQERERVRAEMRSRHAATLTSLLQTLRREGQNGSRSVSPAVREAIDLASQGLLELKATAKRQDASVYLGARQAFAETEAEIRGIARAGDLQIVAGLDAADDARIPRSIAQAARIVTRASALNATQHPGAHKLRVHWRVTAETLIVTVADNGTGFGKEEEGPRAELAYMRRRVAGLRGTVEFDTAPHWGSAVTCELPMHGPPLAPENPAAERISQLRARECEVLELMVAGMRNRDIAERLFITVRTVKFHVSNILRKLEVQSRTEAIALAHAAGISAPDET